LPEKVFSAVTIILGIGSLLALSERFSFGGENFVITVPVKERRLSTSDVFTIAKNEPYLRAYKGKDPEILVIIIAFPWSNDRCDRVQRQMLIAARMKI
jgi:hypothetical protein